MTEIYAITLFLIVLFVLLGTGVWVGLALMGVAWVGMELFTSRPVGDVMLTAGVEAAADFDPQILDAIGQVTAVFGQACAQFSSQTARCGDAQLAGVCSRAGCDIGDRSRTGFS